jgi:DNA-binding SARP family transcriptional activator
MGALKFGILGPLEVRHRDVLVPVRGSREQAVLGVLLLAAGHMVPLARLVAAVWDGDPPQAAGKAVRNTVSALRGRFAQADGAAKVIETSSAGYRLRLEGHRLDAAEFREHAGAATELASAGRTAGAVTECRAALGLWRGPALAGLYSQAIQPGAARSSRQRPVGQPENE